MRATESFARTVPLSIASAASATPSFAAASFSSAARAVAAARRNCMPLTWMPLLPAVGPWSGVNAVSPSTSVVRRRGGVVAKTGAKMEAKAP